MYMSMCPIVQVGRERVGGVAASQFTLCGLWSLSHFLRRYCSLCICVHMNLTHKLDTDFIIRPSEGTIRSCCTRTPRVLEGRLPIRSATARCEYTCDCRSTPRRLKTSAACCNKFPFHFAAAPRPVHIQDHHLSLLPYSCT